MKHAQASRVVVELAEHLSLYQLTVSDDGRGFAQDVGANGDTYGLKAMRERAAYLGGRLEILHRDKGMTVQVIIPKTSAPVGEE
ncbi:hypothetical protein NZD86_04590 [Alicyclobacillus dauci]|uniref:Histidine kinase/HSP90-like ATPase domain-containing protein n=1 Tax=Alicyclobacillus dauci TaxID=1475485 RepID=A0ABY6Z4N0_9BACL|nr:hypothetical protein NZD86_04590 [Alicyclobacillus dauci]